MAPDYAHKWTDEQIEKLDRRMSREYVQAAREMHAKERRWLARFDREREARQKALDNTPEAMAGFEQWLKNRAYDTQWYRGMVEALAESAFRANVAACNALNDVLPTIYAGNANFAAYSIDKGIGMDTRFTLVDESTVRNLMQMEGQDVLNREVVWSQIEPGMEQVQSIRVAEIDKAKDIRWNRQKFNSAITQGILQGESIPNIVKRLDSIYNSNRVAAYRAARTACTSAENAGRVSSYIRARSIGIELKQEWVATLDERTRESHRQLDGQKVEVGGTFKAEGGELRFPGDPTGPAEECWNCRCTLVAAVDGFDTDDADRWSRLPEGTTYDEWKQGKPRTVAELKDERGRWIYESSVMKGQQPSALSEIANEFMPFQTIEDASEYARGFVDMTAYKAKFDISKMSLDSANGLCKALHDVSQRYDFELRSIQPMNFRSKEFKGTTADASYRWLMHDMYFNQNYYKTEKALRGHVSDVLELQSNVMGGARDLLAGGSLRKSTQEFAKGLVESGRGNVANDYADRFVEATFVHELGHALDDQVFRSMYKKGGFDVKESMREYCHKVSGYATASNQEYVAESFTAYMFGEVDRLDPALVRIFEESKR